MGWWEMTALFTTYSTSRAKPMMPNQGRSRRFNTQRILEFCVKSLSGWIWKFPYCNVREVKQMHGRIMPLSIIECFLRLDRRADQVSDEKLTATFVGSGALTAMLSTQAHQVIFGRRGTGKTHALRYLVRELEKKRDLPIYVDLRTAGSNNSIWSEADRPFGERATSLLLEVLRAFHDGLFRTAIERAEELNLSVCGPILDKLIEALNQIQVVGTVETTITRSISSAVEDETGLKFKLAATPSATLGFSGRQNTDSKSENSQFVSGVSRHSVKFGAIAQALSELTRHLQNKRIWLFLDEWSAVPIDLQPYLADIIRRCIFPVRGISVKIAAIQHRSLFQIPGDQGAYIGIELGADAAADLNLDNFMVFENNADAARDFFGDLLHRHYRATEGLGADEGAQTDSEMLTQVFSQQRVFDELVRAAEGVPRDAINISILAAQKAYGGKIQMDHVLRAARDWYQSDKSDALRTSPKAEQLLTWIMDNVIGQRRARAFLLKGGQRHSLIDYLFDARLIHVLKRNIAAHDEPGVRYDVYKLDYGCYVDLANTQKSPLGLLPGEDAVGDACYIDVPPDDYRSIRRAILKLDDYSA